jgi:hypothetical protein
MSLILLSVLAAASLASGAFAVRAVRRRKLPQTDARSSDAPRAVAVDTIVQRDMDSRWLRSGCAFEVDGSARLSLFFADVGAVAAFAPPVREIGWLAAIDLDLGASPPSRIEVGRGVLDLDQSFTAVAKHLGTAPIDLGQNGERMRVAVYKGPQGEMLVALFGTAGARAFSGDVVEPDAFQILGEVADVAG